MWDKLQVTYKGTNYVKETRINTLVYEYKIFRMEEDEKIQPMFQKLIMNDLHNLGRIIPNVEFVMKILRTLPKAWQSMIDAI